MIIKFIALFGLLIASTGFIGALVEYIIEKNYLIIFFVWMPILAANILSVIDVFGR